MCLAKSNYGGGALHLSRNAYVVVRESHFIRNLAPLGRASQITKIFSM
jgi:hypothetical protein